MQLLRFCFRLWLTSRIKERKEVMREGMFMMMTSTCCHASWDCTCRV